jgi:hypothetical protein
MYIKDINILFHLDSFTLKCYHKIAVTNAKVFL